MTIREELDARLAEFDQRRASALSRTDAVLARWEAQRTETSSASRARLTANLFSRRGSAAI